MERRLATILAVDVVGYTLLMGRDEEATLFSLYESRQLIEKLVSEHSGRTFGKAGDSVLAEFASPVKAVRCAIDIQRDMANLNADLSTDRQMQLRIGVNLGDAIVDDNNLFGEGVNIAARLESIAEPGGIVLSKQVYEHIEGRIPIRFISLGKQSVRNVARPIEAYKVDLSSEESPSNVIRFGSYELDTECFELRESSNRLAVEPKVFDLLVYLAKNNDRTISKDEIFAEVWNNRVVSDAALSSQIKAARRVLGDNGTDQHTIRTIHGRGFRFVASIDDNTAEPTNQIAAATEAILPAAVTTKPSVAVLPFENLIGNVDEDYFADGITEDITTALSKNRWLVVVARNSAFAFRDSTDGIRIIGQKLDANYIITGSVRKAGSRVRISTQVVDAETETSIWVERFDRDIADIFELQDEITETLTAQIEAELGLNEQRKAVKQPRKNLGSWNLYQLGMAEFYKFTTDGNLRCQDLLRQSLELDSEFASAHSRLAYAIVLGMVYFDAKPEAKKLDEALKAAKRAIELDDQDANGYFMIGRVHLARREYDLAIDALEYAVDLNPCLAQTYCGLGDSLAYEGRLDEAIEQFEIAIRLSPHDPFRWAFYSYRALAHLFRMEFNDAVTWARKSVEVPNAQYWARAHLVAALGHLGDFEQAKVALANLLQVKPEFSLGFAREHLFYLKRDDQIEMYLTGLKKSGMV